MPCYQDQFFAVTDKFETSIVPVVSVWFLSILKYLSPVELTAKAALNIIEPVELNLLALTVFVSIVAAEDATSVQLEPFVDV
jgi:hypothetical protein